MSGCDPIIMLRPALNTGWSSTLRMRIDCGSVIADILSLHGCHLSQGAGNDLRRRRRLAVVWQSGGYGKAGEPYLAGVVDEYVPRLEVLMYKATPVDLAECCRQANGDTQDASQIGQLAPLKNQINGL